MLKRLIYSNRTLRYSNRAVTLFHVENNRLGIRIKMGHSGEILERIIGKILSKIGSSLIPTAHGSEDSVYLAEEFKQLTLLKQVQQIIPIIFLEQLVFMVNRLKSFLSSIPSDHLSETMKATFMKLLLPKEMIQQIPSIGKGKGKGN